MAGVYDFTAQSLAGEDVPLTRFEGQVLLIVNTASACGFTPQYKGLEHLHRDFSARGFAVLGFPCNQFGGQEPGDAKQIAAFCETKYDVTFPMFAKIDVNGSKRDPIYTQLAGPSSPFPGDIKWNFNKFLIGRDGKILKRFGSGVEPSAAQLVQAVEAALAAK